MKHTSVDVIQSPFRSDVAAMCCIRRGSKVRWLLIAKASRNRVCEAAYSDDIGNSWNLVDIGDIAGEGPMQGGSLCPVTDNVIYFATNKNNVYLSRDGGKTWNLKKVISTSR